MATPTKQELDQIKSLLDEVQKRYDQLGKSNPFKNFDASKVKDADAATKQLEVSLKGVNTELRETNDEFSNVFKSFRSIVNELTNGKTAVNKITNSTRTLEDVSSKILAQKTKGITLDSKELQSLQKKADISFTNLQQQKGEIENQKQVDAQNLKSATATINQLKEAGAFTKENKQLLKEAETLQKKSNSNLAENETRLGNINTILDKGANFQDIINRGLKNEILDRKTIEGSIGITGGLLTSLSKVTGITNVFDINKIKAEAETIAQDAIEAFRQTKEYIDEEIKINLNLENTRTELLALRETSALTKTQIQELKGELEGVEEEVIGFTDRGDIENLEEAQNRIKEIKKSLAEGVDLEIYFKNKNELEESINKSTDALDNLNATARSSANSISSQFKTLGKTLGSVFNGLFDAIKSPEAIFTAIIMAAGEVNSQVVDLQKSLSLSYDEAQDLRGEFEGVASSTNETLITTKNLLAANAEFNAILGLQGEIIAKNSQTFSQLNKRLGISVESAAQLQLIAEATGKDFEQQKLTQYETINAVSQQFGLQLDTKQVMEEVGKAGAYGLAQFQGSVVALTEGVAQAKALGLSLDQVNSIAGKLLDFESSINAELQAELLLGKNINLEKARLAALNNDQVTLMEEINREMGTFEDFSNMNRIQQEAMAEAVGMTVDGLSEALLLQQYGEKSQKEITDLAGEEVAARVEAVKTQEAFAQLTEKLQGALVDIASGPLGDIAKLFTDILGESTAIGIVIGALGFGKLISGIPALMAGLKAIKSLEIGSAVAKIYAGAASLGPFAIPAAIAGTAALVGSIAYATADDYISPGYGKRTLSTPEGTVAFNDKDTIVAGTNLEQNTTTNNNNQPVNNSVINRPTTSMVSNNQPAPQVVTPASNTMMEGELKSIKKLLENIATKEGSISMNGTKFGTVTAMNTYQLQ